MMTNDNNNKDVSKTISVLESPLLSITSPQCVLVFNYYYDSNEISMMEVGHIQEYQSEMIESILWKQQLTSMKKWQQVAIRVGQRPNSKLSF